MPKDGKFPWSVAIMAFLTVLGFLGGFSPWVRPIARSALYLFSGFLLVATLLAVLLPFLGRSFYENMRSLKEEEKPDTGWLLGVVRPSLRYFIVGGAFACGALISGGVLAVLALWHDLKADAYVDKILYKKYYSGNSPEPGE